MEKQERLLLCFLLFCVYISHALQIPEKRCTRSGRSVHSFHLKRYRDMGWPLDYYYS